MQKYKLISKLPMLFAAALIGLLPLHAQQAEPGTPSYARMTVTLRVQGDNKRTPAVTRDDVVVTQNKKSLQVIGWTPASGSRAGLDLFVLLDDASDSSLGSHLDDLRSFITAQPQSTAVGVGYMRNGTVQIAQNFTTDHTLASKALRLPVAFSGTYASPYLSLVDLIKRWPESGNRREVVMVTDGIDRFRAEDRFNAPRFISVDVDTASRAAQRTGTIVDTIYVRGVGRQARNFWEATNGQNGIAKLSDATGGESYFLGTQGPVSLAPYLDDVQRSLGNQYLLEFRAIPGKKSGLQYVNLNTPVAGVELDSADSVWVEAR
jgi:hypothetical protein